MTVHTSADRLRAGFDTPISRRPPSTVFGDASRILRADLRALWIPMATWWLVLVLVAVFDPQSAYFSLRWAPSPLRPFGSVVMTLAPILLAGLFMLQHPVRTLAHWRTCPWHRLAFPLAKLVAVGAGILLPMAVTRQYLMPSGNGLLGLDFWRGFVVFHLLPVLYTMAVAARCQRLSHFVVAGYLGFLLLATPVIPAAAPLAAPADAHFPLRLLVVVALLGYLFLAYSLASPARAALITLSLLAILWLPVRALGSSIASLGGF